MDISPMEQANEICILIKFAEIDDTPYPNEQEGWVSGFVGRLRETLAFYFRKPVQFVLKNETDTISEQEFLAANAIICILSPAFMLSSNLARDMAAIEKAVSFNIKLINAKIIKVLKGPVSIQELPTTISMGTFHHFYQMSSSGDLGYETLFEWDKSASVRAHYWESFTNLVFDLLKSLQHEKWERFIPESELTIFLGPGDLGQLWHRTNLYGEMHARGIKVLPDHDHSIEVKYLNNPLKFYLEKCTAAIHFPEEFLPISEKKLTELQELNNLKRYIWFNPDIIKNTDKKKQYDELKQKLKNLNHIEAVTAGIEELKEIVFAASQEANVSDEVAESNAKGSIYLILPDNFSEALKVGLQELLLEKNVKPLLLEDGNTHQKRVQHYQHLKNCDYCLICYDGKNQEWLKANINEVKKAAGLNPDKTRRIKLGVLALEDFFPEVAANDPGYTLLTMASQGFQEGLIHFLHEK